MSARGAYYNEFDPYAAAWLRNLIAAGHIAPGDVDDRSIKDVAPDDLKGYAQAHFFAGIGVWSYALRLAGWPDDSEVWTGSCPCQPFSAAGRQTGFADERHLWPDWFRLIDKRRPRVIFGEQVSHKSALPWVDAVLADLEGAGYSGGASDICAASVGAPHIRQRTYFVGDAGQQRSRRHAGAIHRAQDESESQGRATWREPHESEPAVTTRRVVDADHAGPQGRRVSWDSPDQRALGTAGMVGGHWFPADWLFCRDGKYRPVEPGTFPLAHGAPARVGRLRAYGNAIVARLAAEFIRAYLTTRP